MEQEEDWERFMATGKIEDYLAYKQISGQEYQTKAVSRQGYEGDSDSDRHGADSITGEGIR